jgi:RNA polymerase sigma factor (sigma-70 family)
VFSSVLFMLSASMSQQFMDGGRWRGAVTRSLAMRRIITPDSITKSDRPSRHRGYVNCVNDSRRHPKAHATCRTCQREFEYTARRDGEGGKFCSNACVSKGNVKHTDAKTHRSFWNGRNQSVETRTCAFCGDAFEIPPAVKQKHCSNKCAAEARSDKRWGKVADEKVDHREYVWLLRWFVRRYIPTGPLAGSDVYQSAWVGLLIACETYRGYGTFSSFVVSRMRRQVSEDGGGRQAVRQARQKLRDEGVRFKQFRPAMLPTAGDEDPVEIAIANELEERVTQVVGSMRTVVQEVVRCRAFKGMTNAETSDELNISRRAASISLSQAREKLSEIRWAWPEDSLPCKSA